MNILVLISEKFWKYTTVGIIKNKIENYIIITKRIDVTLVSYLQHILSVIMIHLSN